MVGKHLGSAKFTFRPVNTQVLLQFARLRRKKSRILKWAMAQPIFTGGSYTGLVNLQTYVDFLKDDNGELDELIFESNVRGYQGDSTINRGISDTLKHASGAGIDFWLLNNGITIIGATLQPVDAMQLSIEDPQVVNGLQTSRRIFNHFQAPVQGDNRSVLVKVIKVVGEEMQDAIIRATNSQNSMKASALRGTDNIHRQIEALFRQYGFYYDRRPGFCKDQGCPLDKIVGSTELVQALVSVLLQRPDDARARPGNYIKEGDAGDRRYASIFGMDEAGNALLPLGVYLKCVTILRRVDSFLEKKQIELGHRRNIKFYVASYVVCDIAKRLRPDADIILTIDPELITDSQLETAYGIVWSRYTELSGTENPDSVAKGPDLLKAMKDELTAKGLDAGETIAVRRRRTRLRGVVLHKPEVKNEK
jgi:hypothetical protein